DLAAHFIALNGSQAAKGADQVVGQFRRNVRLFCSVMHSFSPLRFDLAKQMAFAVLKTSQSHAQYPSAPLRKTCICFRTNLSALAVFSRRTASPSRRKACVELRDAPAHRIHVAFRDMPHAKSTTFNIVISAP